MKKDVLVITNPISGRGSIKQHLLSIVLKLSALDYEVSVYPTKKKGDATRYIKTNQKTKDLIVVTGGDGTLNEVTSGLIQQNIQTPIIYLPTGTTNDFATTLGIPKQVPQALEMGLKQNFTLIDVGKFNERYFSYVAAFGAFTDVAYETPQGRKNRLGGLAYLIEGILKLPTVQSYECEIQYDGQTIQGDYIFGMISNSDSVAGIKNAFGNQADLQDGLFEVTLIRAPKTLIDFHRILNDFLNTNYDPEYVLTFKTNHIRIQSQKAMKWTLDGEDGGALNEVQIENLNQRLMIAVPSSR